MCKNELQQDVEQTEETELGIRLVDAVNLHNAIIATECGDTIYVCMCVEANSAEEMNYELKLI